MSEMSVELLGFAGAAVSIFVYVSSTMIPLRIAAVIANLLLAAYFFLRGVYPQCALNLALLPVNLYRLREMLGLVKAVRTASREDFDFDWLRPFMKPLKLQPGEYLYAIGEQATEAYVVVSGAILIPERDATLKQGALFGEFGMYSVDNRRTASARAIGEAELLKISYSDILQLSAQNPTFGFYLTRLIMRRMQKNLELAQKEAASARRESPSAAIATS
ncbi:MAG: cyclic nucleotide-binding domain-containing protein [Hyphomicrobiales bacterium]|nr:cyclic nucleotide-binding domain-containing protein [Hyphomicrobiales bacterium]